MMIEILILEVLWTKLFIAIVRKRRSRMAKPLTFGCTERLW